MSAIDAPACRLCHKPHWPRDGCDFSGRGLAAAKAVVAREANKAAGRKAGRQWGKVAKGGKKK